MLNSADHECLARHINILGSVGQPENWLHQKWVLKWDHSPIQYTSPALTEVEVISFECFAPPWSKEQFDSWLWKVIASDHQLLLEIDHTVSWGTMATCSLLDIHWNRLSEWGSCQSETRLIGRGSRCLQPPMGTAEVLCEPSMVPDFQGSYTSEEPPGSDNSHNFSVEGPTTAQYPVLLGMLYNQLPYILTDPRPVL